MAVCEICGRRGGSTKNLDGEEDGVPLGETERCDLCGKLACPDCLHEADCCFVDEPDDDPAWCPPGWRRANATTFERIHV